MNKIYVALFLSLYSCQKIRQPQSQKLGQHSPNCHPSSQKVALDRKNAFKLCLQPLTSHQSQSLVSTRHTGTPLRQFCSYISTVKAIDSARSHPHRVQCLSKAQVDFTQKSRLADLAKLDSCLILPKNTSTQINLSYCQRDDPKVMNSTGGSCLAMSWYWALAQFKDDHAVSLIEEAMLKTEDQSWTAAELSSSAIYDFFNTLKKGDTDPINEVQLAIERKNNRLFRLLKSAAHQDPSQSPPKKLTEEILSLRNDQVSFLKLVPFEANDSYHPTRYNEMYPSHNQYPDLKLYPIPNKADFRKIFSHIQSAIKSKVHKAQAIEHTFPISGRKIGLYIFHLLGDGTAHAMGLKYTFLAHENREFWTFFDPSSGEVLTGDEHFIETMLQDFYIKRYDSALAYTFHEVVGIKPQDVKSE